MPKYVVTIVLEKESGEVVQDSRNGMMLLTDMHEELAALWNKLGVTAIYYGNETGVGKRGGSIAPNIAAGTT